MLKHMARRPKSQTRNPPRVAIVAGGGKRVGRAIVERLAEAGFDIAFTYHSSEKDAQSLVAALKRRGRRAVAISADLAQPAAAEQVARAYCLEFDRVDVLVNNASLYEPSPLRTVSDELLARFWSIHVATPMLLCSELEAMLRQSGGHVVNMIDLLAQRPWPAYLGYATSKAGLAALTVGLARELAPEVTVNGIAPGVVEWPEDYPAEERKKYLKRVPLARAGTPADVANLVHFLCTEGSYITGQIIRLDGGRSIT